MRPTALLDDVDGAERDCEALIARWHGRGRLAYAVTPRFAPTSSDAGSWRMPARCCRGTTRPVHADARRREPRRGALGRASCSPSARSYLDVYAQHGLLHRALGAGARHLARRRPTARCSHTRGAHDRPLPELEPVPRQRPVRLAAGARPPAWPSAWPPTSAAAPACRCSARWPTRYKVQALRRHASSAAWDAAARGHARRAREALGLGARDRLARRRRGRRPVRVGLGRSARSLACASSAARDLHEQRVRLDACWATSATWSNAGSPACAVTRALRPTEKNAAPHTGDKPCCDSNWSASASSTRRCGQRRRQPARPARRDPCGARRERRRQVDADEDHLRRGPARRGRDPLERRSRSTSATRSRRARWASAWCSSTSACSTR